MTDIKDWMKQIETLEPPEQWEPSGKLSMPPPRPDRLRRIGTIVLASVLAFTGGALAIVSLTPRASGPVTGGGGVPDQLQQLAIQVAANNGDPQPDLVLWGLVPVAQANPLLGLSSGPSGAEEYLVVMDGDFTCDSCSRPAGPPPGGPSIAFTVDPSSWRVNDFTIGRVPSIANLRLQPMGRGPYNLFTSDRAPWTFPLPRGWSISTGRSAPDPNLMTGVLETWATNAPYRFRFGRSPSPNGRGGASQALGPDAAVVLVQLFFSPPEDEPTWSPSGATEIAPAGRWHADAQNQGWMFRERRVCRGSACVQVLEWHGPDASAGAVGLAQHVAESIELGSS